MEGSITTLAENFSSAQYFTGGVCEIDLHYSTIQLTSYFF